MPRVTVHLEDSLHQAIRLMAADTKQSISELVNNALKASLQEDLEDIQNNLKQNDVPSVSYYSVPLHLQPVFKNLGHKEGDFPVAEKVANQCLSLPMSPYLTQEDQSQVINAISSI